MANDTYVKEGKSPLILTERASLDFLGSSNGNCFDMVIEGVATT
jgi:hypothetical protein